MKKLFDLDNLFWRLVSALADAVGLSLLWLVCCIPLVTAGAATAALYYALTQHTRKLESGAFRAYFRSFRMNLRQGLGAGLIVLPLMILVAFGWWFVSAVGAGQPWGLGVLLGYGILTALPVGMALYVFPVLARFEYTLGELLRSALYLSMNHLLSTLALRIFTALCIYVSVAFLLPAALLPAVCLLVWSAVMERVFRAFSPELAAQAQEELLMKKGESESER